MVAFIKANNIFCHVQECLGYPLVLATMEQPTSVCLQVLVFITSNSVFESAISVSLFSCAMCCLQCYQQQFEQYNKEIL